MRQGEWGGKGGCRDDGAGEKSGETGGEERSPPQPKPKGVLVAKEPTPCAWDQVLTRGGGTRVLGP